MIVIVEGKNDYNKIKSIFPKLNVMVTNGSAVDNSFLQQLVQLSKIHEIVLCLDPDFSGEKIRKQITAAIPKAKHLFAKRQDAISKNGKKIGIEHMKNEDIIELFKNIRTSNFAGNISYNDLYNLGLIGNANSKELRIKLGEKLGIGYANSKQLLKKLNMFNISIKEVKRNL